MVKVSMPLFKDFTVLSLLTSIFSDTHFNLPENSDSYNLCELQEKSH